jgi:hypothetical protein
MKQIQSSKRTKSPERCRNDIQLIDNLNTKPIMEQIQSAKKKGTRKHDVDAVRSVGPIKGNVGVKCRGALQMPRRNGVRSP